MYFAGCAPAMSSRKRARVADEAGPRKRPRVADAPLVEYVNAGLGSLHQAPMGAAHVATALARCGSDARQLVCLGPTIEVGPLPLPVAQACPAHWLYGAVADGLIAAACNDHGSAHVLDVFMTTRNMAAGAVVRCRVRPSSGAVPQLDMQVVAPEEAQGPRVLAGRRTFGGVAGVALSLATHKTHRVAELLALKDVELSHAAARVKAMAALHGAETPHDVIVRRLTHEPPMQALTLAVPVDAVTECAVCLPLNLVYNRRPGQPGRPWDTLPMHTLRAATVCAPMTVATARAVLAVVQAVLADDARAAAAMVLSPAMLTLWRVLGLEGTLYQATDARLAPGLTLVSSEAMLDVDAAPDLSEAALVCYVDARLRSPVMQALRRRVGTASPAWLVVTEALTNIIYTGLLCPLSLDHAAYVPTSLTVAWLDYVCKGPVGLELGMQLLYAAFHHLWPAGDAAPLPATMLHRHELLPWSADTRSLRAVLQALERLRDFCSAVTTQMLGTRAWLAAGVGFGRLTRSVCHLARSVRWMTCAGQPLDGAAQTTLDTLHAGAVACCAACQGGQPDVLLACRHGLHTACLPEDFQCPTCAHPLAPSDVLPLVEGAEGPDCRLADVVRAATPPAGRPFVLHVRLLEALQCAPGAVLLVCDGVHAGNLPPSVHVLTRDEVMAGTRVAPRDQLPWDVVYVSQPGDAKAGARVRELALLAKARQLTQIELDYF